ncbi:MAG: hypothetical protein ACLSAP_03575 [Oscillospiraceae bacterium]
MDSRIEKLLLQVQKPGRYTGGELNAVVKDKNKVDVRFAFVFRMNTRLGCHTWA